MTISDFNFDDMLEICREQPTSTENIRRLMLRARSREQRTRAVALFAGLRPETTIQAKVRLSVADLLEGFNVPDSAARWRDPSPRARD